MRQLATIQIIKSLEPIDGADRIELCKFENCAWQVVVDKDKYEAGDPVIYCEIDSVLPPSDAYPFLERYGWRVKTIRLKGVISQGIVFPTSALFYNPEVKQVFIKGTPKGRCSREEGNTALILSEGEDVTEILDIIKYEAPIPACLSGDAKGGFPSFLKKSDSDRIQSNTWILKDCVGVTFVFAEKLDGSSCTVYVNEGDFGVCSRNLNLKENDTNSFWRVVRALDLEDKLRGLNRNIAVQFELIGNGVQKNPYNLGGLDGYIFDFFDIDTQRYLPTYEAKAIADSLDLKWCPIIGEYTITESTTIDELLSMAEGKSVLNPVQEREGLVFRPVEEQYHPLIGRLAFKAISNKFLLKGGD